MNTKTVILVILLGVIRSCLCHRFNVKNGTRWKHIQSLKFDELNRPFIDLSKGFRLRVEDEPVTDAETLAKVNEVSETRQKAIDELKALVEAEKNFEYPHDEDIFYLLFLRHHKFNVQQAFERMKNFFNFQSKYKSVSQNLTSKSVLRVFRDDLIKFSPVRDKNGRRVCHIHGGHKWDPSSSSLTDMFRAVMLSLHAAMLEPLSQINGVSVILDTNDLSFSQIFHFSPSFASMVLEWLQDCVPMKIEGIYVTNNSYVLGIIYEIFKPFIHEEFRDRVHFVGENYEKLQNHLGRQCLRKDLGGVLEAEEVNGKVLVDYINALKPRLEEFTKGGFIKK